MDTKIISVVGARPNFMKVAPLHRAFQATGAIDSKIVHTGQHYDEKMSDVFFRQLELPEPDRYLGVGSGTHAEQTARVMVAFEKVVLEEQPDLVLVVGDVNSTLACSIVASKLHFPVAHVEAGLRSGDRTMPEEINRIVTDSISDYLFVTEQSGMDNLRLEGVPEEKVFFAGNVMIDSLVHFVDKARSLPVLQDLGIEPGKYVLVTMHRPVNVDNPEGLARLAETIARLGKNFPIIFPIHPRTRDRLDRFGLTEALAGVPTLQLLEPLGYLQFMRLMADAGVVVTDSGGIQEETTFLRVPCLTLRENTERPATVDIGSNKLLPLEPETIEDHVASIMNGFWKDGDIPPLWDGRAAERIADILVASLQGEKLALY